MVLGPRASLFVRAATRVLYALSPVATYTPQFYEMKSSGKEGFSSATCLVVLALSVVRVAFWIVRRVREWSFLVYSIMLTLMQFYLLEAIISSRNKKGEVSPRRRRVSGSAAALGSNVKKLARAWWNGGDDQALWRKLRKSFWAWDELSPYVEVVVVMSIGVALVSVAALRLVSRDSYSWFLGTCVALCDVLVAVPQLRMNCVRKDTSGLSTLMVFAWFSRDILLLFDQRLTTAQHEQLGAIDNSANWQHQVISSPRTGLAVCRVVADALLLAQIAVFTYFAPFFRRRRRFLGETRCCLLDRLRLWGSSDRSSAKSNNRRHYAIVGNDDRRNSHLLRDTRHNDIEGGGKHEDEDVNAIVHLLVGSDDDNENTDGPSCSANDGSAPLPATTRGMSTPNKRDVRSTPSAGAMSTTIIEGSTSTSPQKVLHPVAGLKKKFSDVNLSSRASQHLEEYSGPDDSNTVRTDAASDVVSSGSLTAVTGKPRGRQQHVS